MPAIRFFYEEVKFRLSKTTSVRSWIKHVILLEHKTSGELNYIFCSDNELASINSQFLNHDAYTDIITFDGKEDDGQIQGDIYISIDRIKENSSKFETQFISELHRVMIHGVLHLIGYSDKTKSERQVMRNKEEAYLSLWTNGSFT